MIRPFKNIDPPRLVDLWARQPRRRGLAAFVDVNTLEALVFSKQYFDAAGLLVAERDHRIIGFAHAGFGPNAAGDDLDTELGVTCLVMVDPAEADSTLASELLLASEDYLRRRGAKVLYGGGIRPLDAFYLGLYGGSEMPGILASDKFQVDLFQRHDYQVTDECLVYQLDTGRFRQLIDRQQLLIKRSYKVSATHSAVPPNWWTACTAPLPDPTRFEVFPSQGGPSCGQVHFWWMDPIARDWGSMTAGLYDLVIDEPVRRSGLGTLLVAESVRQLRLNGVQLIEAQTMRNNAAAIHLFEKLGFEQVDRGLIFRKAATPSPRSDTA